MLLDLVKLRSSRDTAGNLVGGIQKNDTWSDSFRIHLDQNAAHEDVARPAHVLAYLVLQHWICWHHAGHSEAAGPVVRKYVATRRHCIGSMSGALTAVVHHCPSCRPCHISYINAMLLILFYVLRITQHRPEELERTSSFNIGKRLSRSDGAHLLPRYQHDGTRHVLDAARTARET